LTSLNKIEFVKRVLYFGMNAIFETLVSQGSAATSLRYGGI